MDLVFTVLITTDMLCSKTVHWPAGVNFHQKLDILIGFHHVVMGTNLNSIIILVFESKWTPIWFIYSWNSKQFVEMKYTRMQMILMKQDNFCLHLNGFSCDRQVPDSRSSFFISADLIVCIQIRFRVKRLIPYRKFWCIWAVIWITVTDWFRQNSKRTLFQEVMLFRYWLIMYIFPKMFRNEAENFRRRMELHFFFTRSGRDHPSKIKGSRQ